MSMDNENTFTGVIQISDAIRTFLWTVLSGVHTATVGSIETYDHTKFKADVKPHINRKYADGKVLEMPVLPNVPVMWPRSKDTFIHFPLVKGDYVLVLFAERSIEDWLLKGKTVTPEMQRAFDLADAIAIPGIVPFNQTPNVPNNEDLFISHKNQKITIKADGNIEVGASGLKNLVNDTFKDLFNEHTHEAGTFFVPLPSPQSPTPVQGASGAPVSTMTDSHLTSKVKAQ